MAEHDREFAVKDGLVMDQGHVVRVAAVIRFVDREARACLASEEPWMSAVPPAATETSESEEPRTSAVALVATVRSESEQPRNMTFVPVPSFHTGLMVPVVNGSFVKLLPVQIPVEVPWTIQSRISPFLAGAVVLPMIRKRQSPLNSMPLRRPASHSKRQVLSVHLPLGTEDTPKTKSPFATSVADPADRPFTVRPPLRKQP